MRYWLLKSEPGSFSIDDLERSRDATTGWDGVRNYQARNMLRDQMKLGDRAFLYHSNCALPGVVGIMEVVREGYPDPTAFDRDDPHYDPGSDPQQPRWFQVDVKLVRRLDRCVPLQELKANPALAECALVRRGNRLSVMPLSGEQWQAILAMEHEAEAPR